MNKSLRNQIAGLTAADVKILTDRYASKERNISDKELFRDIKSILSDEASDMEDLLTRSGLDTASVLPDLITLAIIAENVDHETGQPLYDNADVEAVSDDFVHRMTLLFTSQTCEIALMGKSFTDEALEKYRVADAPGNAMDLKQIYLDTINRMNPEEAAPLLAELRTDFERSENRDLVRRTIDIGTTIINRSGLLR